jgi:hypothetical protein
MVSFFHVSTPQPCMRFSSPHIFHMLRPFHLLYSILIKSGEGCRSCSYSLCNFCSRMLRRTSWVKYFPQPPVLELPWPMFFSQCDWPSFKPKQNTDKITFLLKLINQPDAANSQVYYEYLSFKYSSTCFNHPHAHHQELSNCCSSL